NPRKILHKLLRLAVETRQFTARLRTRDKELLPINVRNGRVEIQGTSGQLDRLPPPMEQSSPLRDSKYLRPVLERGLEHKIPGIEGPISAALRWRIVPSWEQRMQFTAVG